LSKVDTFQNVKHVYAAKVIEKDGGNASSEIQVLSTNHTDNRQVVRLEMPNHYLVEDFAFDVDGEVPAAIQHTQIAPGIIEFLLTMPEVIAQEEEQAWSEIETKPKNRLKIKPAQEGKLHKRREAVLILEDEVESERAYQELTATETQQAPEAVDLEVSGLQFSDARLVIPADKPANAFISFRPLLPFPDTERTAYTFEFLYERRSGYGSDKTTQTKVATGDQEIKADVYFAARNKPFELIVTARSLESGMWASAILSSSELEKITEVSAPPAPETEVA
jgi:hypothetical protein